MIAFHIIAIEFSHVAHSHVLQVNHVEVGIFVPNVETAIFCHAEEQVAPIGRDAWECGTLAECVGVENKFGRAECLGLRIERFAVDIVLELFVVN